MEPGGRVRRAMLLASAGVACALASAPFAASAANEKADLAAAVEAVEAQVIVTSNDPELARRMRPTPEWAAGLAWDYLHGPHDPAGGQ